MFNRYNLEKITDLEHGGQKQVMLCSSNKFGWVVYKTGKCYSENSLKRIIREVEILHEINSQYFPKIFDFNFSNTTGEFQILEQYIPSKSLNQYKNIFNNESKVISLLLELIEGMKLLWDKSIVHRDLKPNNILIKADLHPVIIDLGIARINTEDSLTNTNLPSGPRTPVYSAPEQILNRKNLIDMRTDFFILGIVSAELLLNSNPFDPIIAGGKFIEDNIVKGQYNLSNGANTISNNLTMILEKMLQNKQFLRYKNYSLLQTDLLKIRREYE